MNEYQIEIKQIIERAMGYAQKLNLTEYRVNFMEIWDSACGRKLERLQGQLDWIKTLRDTTDMRRLHELLTKGPYLDKFQTGPESIFMGEMITTEQAEKEWHNANT